MPPVCLHFVRIIATSIDKESPPHGTHHKVVYKSANDYTSLTGANNGDIASLCVIVS